MKKMRKVLLLLACLVASAGLLVAELPGTPVFTDDFDVPALFIENWSVTTGTSLEDDHVVIPAGNSLTLRAVQEGDFVITADVTVEEPESSDLGHCGVTLDGIHFMSVPRNPPTAQTAYRVPGETSSRGTLVSSPGIAFGVACRFEISRSQFGQAYYYTFKVNDQVIDAFVVAMPLNGTVSFYGYWTSLKVDNFRLYSLTENPSQNLAVNSSFEYLQEGMPTYMKPLMSGSKYLFDDAPWTNFITAFAVDTQEKVSGNQSVRMTCGTTYPLSNGVGTHNASVIADYPVTFSVYLKASTNGLVAKLNIWELWYANHSTNIILSQEWQRYSFTWTNPVKSTVRGNVTFTQPGTVWADDIQIEIGDAPTDYLASPLDDQRFAPAPTNTPIVTLEIEEEVLPPGDEVLYCYTRLNYYMNEEVAVLAGTLALPDAARLTGSVTVNGTTREFLMAGKFALDIPLQGIAAGEYPVSLQVFQGEEMVASATNTLIKRTFQVGATQIDHQRRCLVVDGEPYLVIAPFFGFPRPITTNIQAQVITNMLRLHKDMGYRCFLSGAVDSSLVPAQAQSFHELCAQDGVKIIYWPFQSWSTREEFTPAQRFQTMTSTNIIGWLVVDEPELYAESTEVEAYMEAYRSASPYTPVFMNNSVIGIPGRFAGLKTDILMLDDYLTNREGRKVAEMVESTRMMMEVAREGRQPAFYFLEGEDLPNHYRECTYAEQMAQTYGVIIAGARGVSYFCSLPLYPEDYRACVDANRELLELEDVIFSLERTSPVTVTGTSIIHMTRRVGNQLYVIALNADNDHTVEGQIGLPAEFRYASNAEVKFESRQVSVTDGSVTDTFAPLSRHVYVADILPARYVVPPGSAVIPIPGYTSWETAATNIQDAVDAADPGDYILVASGIYPLTNPLVVDKAVTLRSCSPDGIADPSETILDGGFPARTNRCIYVNNVAAVIDGFTLTNGYAATSSLSGYGGGFYLNLQGTLTNCVIAVNHAESRGGGGYLSGHAHVLGSLITGNCVLTNSAASYGGGLFADKVIVDGKPVIGACTVRGNSARRGGGVFLNNDSVSNGDCLLTDSRIEENTAWVCASAEGSAGVNMQNKGTIANCEIISNVIAKVEGSGYGGGVLIGSGGILRDSLIAYNSGADYGGGVQGGSSRTASNCVIRNNSANYGGGIYPGGTALFVDCMVVSNSSAAFVQGGIMRNCLFAYNDAGIWNQTATPGQYQNCTIVNNGGVGIRFSIPGFVENCIVYNNNSGGNNWSYDGTGSDTVWTNSCTIPLPGGTDDVDNTANAPAFVDAVAGDYHLDRESPCIDAGAMRGWMVGAADLDGVTRVSGVTVDMGAYESTLLFHGAVLILQ